MKYHVKAKENGTLDLESNSNLVAHLQKNAGKEFIVELKPKGKRSNSQNSSIHLYLTHRAETLADKGHTIQDVVRAIRRAQIIPTMELLKEIVWKGIQWVMFRKKSTTQLDKLEVDKVYETCEHFFQKEFPDTGYVPFPSQEELSKQDPNFIPN